MTGTSYCEVFVSVEEDEETGAETEVYAFRCNICGRDLTDGSCPDHAPRDIPGLRLVECDRTPPHVGWVVDAEDYGVPCPWCSLDYETQRVAELEVQRDRHGRWRGWPITFRLARWAYALGVTSGSCYGTCRQAGHGWCVKYVTLRGSRPYVLGWPRNNWRCLLKGRHWPGEHVGFGLCGKCVPWQCCGSRTVEHLPGCADE